MNTRAPAPQLKGFTYERLLGSGGFADVYLYEQHLPRRRVAVKVMASDALAQETRDSFVAEANLMAQLAHPYIVKIHHADIADDGRPYIIMEYCAGANLATRYKAQPLTVVEALQTGIRISGAVATAHAAGVLHRDIKPHNVLANDYGWPILTDFGISSVADDDAAVSTTMLSGGGAAGATGSTSATGSKSVGMSIPWSPPEMFDDDPRPDTRSDVFSLAATVWTLLAGRSPFEVAGGSNGSLDLMSRIELGSITPLERRDVPASFIGVLRKGMSTDRRARYASAVDFARALQAVEVELSLPPTQLDVAAQTVAESARHTAPDAPDATRARGVTSIAAQPAAPQQAPVAPPVGIAPGGVQPQRVDATVMRGGAAVPAAAAPAIDRTVMRGASTPTTEIDPSAAAAAPSQAKPKGKLIAIVAVVAVVVAGGVTAAVLALGAAPAQEQAAPGGTDTDPDTEQVDDSDGGSPVVGSTVPTPVLATAAAGADGSSVVFTWTNPEPADGDTFVWHRTDGAGDDQMVPATEPTATVTGVTPGTTVCIEVFVRRSGELSPTPLEACVP